jgi:hypothetical protein
MRLGSQRLNGGELGFEKNTGALSLRSRLKGQRKKRFAVWVDDRKAVAEPATRTCHPAH